MREYASLLVQHLRHAWENIQASASSFDSILLARDRFKDADRADVIRPGQEVEDGPPSNESTMERSPSPLRRRKVKQRRKVNDRSQRLNEDNFDDDFDDILGDIPQQDQPQERCWSLLIVVLVFANLILAYVHTQRRVGKHNLHVANSLTDDSFSDHILAHPNGTLVNFFSSSCEPCAKLAPDFGEAARQLQKTTNVSLVSANVDLAPSTTKQYLVTRLPALLWFRRGRLVRDAPHSVRSTAQISEFVHESLESAVIEFDSYAEFVEAIPQLRAVLSKGKTPPIVAGFGPDPAVHEVLEQVGELLEKIKEGKDRKFQQSIELQIGLKDYDPQKDKRFVGTVRLPNCPREKLKLCIIGDQQHKDEAAKAGIECLDVTDLDTLKKFNKDKKLIKKWAKKYSMLLASDTVLKKVPAIVGPILNRIQRFPTQVNHAAPLAAQVADIRSSVKFQLKKVTCLATCVGHEKMSQEELKSNIMMSLNFLVSLLKKGWHNLKSVHIKATMSPSIKLL